MAKVLKNKAEKLRYILVGGFNTLLDFVLLFSFVALGVDKIVANYFSTGIAMVVSFFANKSFTFKDTASGKKRQFILFIAILLFIAKLTATGASLVWNYILYSRVVFKKGHDKTEVL